MQILFLTAQLPEPAHAGGTLRTNGLMRAAHAAGHAVHLLAFGTPDQLTPHRPALDAYCASVTLVPPPHRTRLHRLRDLLMSSKPDMQRRYDSPLLARRLTGILTREPFDVIQLESLEMAAYLPIIQRQQPDTPVIYDSFNAEFDLQRSIYDAEKRDLRRLPGAAYSWIQWRRLRRFEREVCEAVTHVIAVSDADAETFRHLTPACRVSVIPNGIDVDRYAPRDAALDLGPHALVFTGSMAYRPNVDAALWFAEHVLDRVRAQVPGAQFYVVGSSPHTRLDVLRDRDGVEITGWVPEVNPYLHAAAVYVVPLRMGSGTRLKVLQAMAAGQAVVSTTTGALGLHVEDGVQLQLADTEDAFAQAVISLLTDPGQRAALGQAGAEYVRRWYDWSVITPDLLRIYDEIGKSKRGDS